MAEFTDEEIIALKTLIARPQKIISDLELDSSINGDEVLPVEDGSSTKNVSIDDLKDYVDLKIGETTSTATAAGTTTLTSSSTPIQIFTGTTTQTVVLPNATTLGKDKAFRIVNSSTGALTVNYNGGSLAITVAAGSSVIIKVLDISTAAGVWIILLTTSTESLAGLSKVATQAIANAAANDTDFITALKAGLLQRPTFSAYLSTTQALSSSTETRVNCNVELWDTNNWYDNATNYRYTPQRAGYYLVNAAIELTPDSDQAILIETRIRKNGAVFNKGTVVGRPSSTPTATANCSLIFPMNGTTDYFDLAAYSSGSGTIQANTAIFSAIYLGGL